MVESLGVDSLLDIFVEEEVSQDDLPDVAGDLGTSRGPSDKPDVPFPVDDDGRNHGREGSLTRDGKVVGRGRDAEAVGDAGIGEVVHFVVQNDSRGRRQYLGAKAGGEEEEGEGNIRQILDDRIIFCGHTHKRLTVLVTATASPLAPMTDVWDVP